MVLCGLVLHPHPLGGRCRRRALPNSRPATSRRDRPQSSPLSHAQAGRCFCPWGCPGKECRPSGPHRVAPRRQQVTVILEGEMASLWLTPVWTAVAWARPGRYGAGANIGAAMSRCGWRPGRRSSTRRRPGPRGRRPDLRGSKATWREEWQRRRRTLASPLHELAGPGGDRVANALSSRSRRPSTAMHAANGAKR